MRIASLIFFFFISCITSFSQTYSFHCGAYDYISDSGGGLFLDVDGSGIDLAIAGMANDYCGGPSIVTGINNGANEGVVHTYVFTFSEPVDVSFSISDINVDLELPCYYDYLFFEGDPTFTYLNNVSTEGNAIIPTVPVLTSASAGISYENVTTFIFKHGDGGTSCNPGLIRIGNLKFTPVSHTSSTPELLKDSIFIVNNIVQNELLLRGDFEVIPALSVVDMLGRKIDLSFSLGQDLSIDTSFLPNGQYILYYEEEQEMKVERFIVSH